MASIIKTVGTSVTVITEAVNNVAVSGSNVIVNMAKTAETTIDTINDAVLIAKSHSNTLKVETELDNSLKLEVIKQLAEDAEYKKTVKDAYRTAKLAELQDELDLEITTEAETKAEQG